MDSIRGRAIDYAMAAAKRPLETGLIKTIKLSAGTSGNPEPQSSEWIFSV